MQANPAAQKLPATTSEMKQAKIAFAQACKRRAKLRKQRLAAEQRARDTAFAHHKEQLKKNLQALKKQTLK